MKLNRAAALKLAVRLTVSALLIAVVIAAAGAGKFSSIKLWLGAGSLAAAGAAWLAGILLLALRLKLLVEKEAMPLTSGTALRLTLEGHAFGQVTPGLLGGDLWRSIRLVRLGLGSTAAIRAIVLDRILGMAGLAVLACIASALAARVTPTQAALLGLGVLLALAAGLLLARHLDTVSRLTFWARIPKPLRSLANLTTVRMRGLDLALLILLALLGHAANCIAFLLVAAGIGLHVPLATALVVLSVAFFLAALPVAFGGWGAREAAIAAGFAAIGQDPALPVAASIVYGLLILAGSLPGFALLLVDPARGPLSKP